MKKFKGIIFLFPAVLITALAIIGTKMNVLDLKPEEFQKVMAKENDNANSGDSDAGQSLDEGQSGNSFDNDKVNDNASLTDGESEKLKAQEAELVSDFASEDVTWKDGVYTGSAKGFGGAITAKVTIKDGKIVSIEITDHANETPEFYDRASVIVDTMLKEQTPLVDGVTGATYSSNGIKGAVVNALNQAVTKKSEDQLITFVTDNDTSSNGTNGNDAKGIESLEGSNSNAGKKTAIKSANGPKDGVYEGSATCDRFFYTVNLKVKFKGGKAVAIYGLSITDNDDEENENYWKTAWKPIVKEILASQNSQVDTVSGATYSSNAIMDAYIDAYNKAVTANGANGYTTSNKNSTSDKADSKNGRSSKDKTSEEQNKSDITDEKELEKIKTGTITDGTYEVSGTCEPDEYVDFKAYTMYASFVFKDGVLTDITNLHSSDESNEKYYTKAANGTNKCTGIIKQFVNNKNVTKVSAVSGATCSSKTLRKMYITALSKATGVTQKDDVLDDMDSKDEENSDSDKGDSSDSGSDEDGKGNAGDSSDSDSDSKTDGDSGNNSGDNSGGKTDENTSNTISIKDGTYTVTTTVWPDEWEDFYEYNLTCDFVFADGKLTSIGNLSLTDEDNLFYCNLALNGRKNNGLLAKLKNCEGTDDLKDVDGVSGATCSSDAFKTLYRQAYTQATADK